MPRGSEFSVGLRLGGATGLVTMASVYAFVAPTRDVRARIPFLLDSGGGALGILVLLVLFALGTLLLMSTQRLTQRGVAGVAVASLGCFGLLQSGSGVGLLPSFEGIGARWLALAVVLALGGILVWLAARTTVRTPNEGDSSTPGTDRTALGE